MGNLVLIADDDPDIVRFVALNLRLEGFDVVVADNGQDALDKALDAHPSLILLDTMMPRLDGYEVCSRLRDRRLAERVRDLGAAVEPSSRFRRRVDRVLLDDPYR